MHDFEGVPEPTLRPFELMVCVGVVELGEKADARAIAVWLARELATYRDDAVSVGQLFKTLDHLEILGVLECHHPKDTNARALYGLSQWGLRIAEKRP